MSVSQRRTNRRTIFIIGILIVGLVVLIVRANQGPANGPLKEKTAVVYRSKTCGCCGQYIAYLRKAGAKVEERLSEDMTTVRKQLGVPEELSSCHTTQIEDYIVEGHIPTEAIQKLLLEKPLIAGIAMPGMPSGSPGMPGAKYGTFDISSFTANGSSSPYVSL